MTKFKFVYLLIFVINFSLLSAQDKIIHKNKMINNWSVKDGLISNAIFKIVKTHQSYLFMATYSGIAIFDGNKFSSYTYQNTNSLKADVISDFCNMNDGTIWIATNKGIFKFKEKKFSRIEGLEQLNNLNIQNTHKV